MAIISMVVPEIEHATRALLTLAERLLLQPDWSVPADSPAQLNYSREAFWQRGIEDPARGWLGRAEIRDKHRQLVEAVAAERFVEGFLLAVKLLALIGGGL